MMEEKKIIDCFGDICPLPILKIEKQLLTMERGDEFLLVTDHSCTVVGIREKYKNADVEFVVDEVMNGVWEVHIKKR